MSASGNSSRNPAVPWDEVQRDLADATRALAKRVYDLAASAKQTTGQFRQSLNRAAQALEDAAEYAGRAAGGQHHSRRDLAGNRSEDVAALMASASESQQGTDPPARFLEADSSTTLLTGSTRVVPVPEMLEFIGTLKKTGIMFVRAGRETYTLQLEDGYLVHASSSASPSGTKLGDYLVKLGFITQERLAKYLEKHSRWQGKLGIALERDGIVTREQLTQALEHQVRGLFDRLFSLQNATFSFSQRSPCARENRIRIGITSLLLESARAQDESRSG